jgi:predicted nucleic acid-binding protein
MYNLLIDANVWIKYARAKDIAPLLDRSVTENAVYGISPDPKDNYLFDIAVQNNCVFIISDDTQLVHFKLKPVPVHTTSWFLKKFPISK